MTAHPATSRMRQLRRSWVGQPKPTGTVRILPGELAIRSFGRVAALYRFLVPSLLLLAGCAPERPDPWSAEALARLPLRERAAQLLVVPIRVGATAPAPLGAVGGVQLVGGAMAGSAHQVDSLQRTAYRPLLVIADLDRGLGGVLSGATELPAARSLADADQAREAARLAASEAQAAGVNVALVAGPQALPGAADGAQAYATGLVQEDLAVVLRALAAPPGDSVIEWDRAALEAGGIRGLRRAVGAVAGVEPAWAILPALTGDSIPLPMSPGVIQGLLRRDLGFAGVVVADLARTSGWRGRFGARAPIAALAAGADLLLGVEDPQSALDSIQAALADGRLPRARLEQAVARVFAMKSALELRRPLPEDARPGQVQVAPDAADVAMRLHGAALRRSGRPAEVLRGCRAPVLAAVQPAEIAVLEGEMARRRPGVQAVQADSVPTRGPWTPAADCVVLVSVNGRGPGAVPGAAPPADSAVPPRRIVRVTLGGAAPPEGVWAFAPESDAIAQRLMAGVLLGDGAPPAGPTPSPTLLPAAPESAGMRVDSLRAIDAAMRSALEAGVFTGGVVVVARRGLVVKATGYGRTAGQPVDPASTLFDLASLTKIVGTTAATMALVDDSVLSVSDPLRRHLSGYRGGGRGDITLRHLLTHTSGLPAGADLFGAHSAQAAFGRVRRAELVTEPGEAYRYSDFGMILLAQAIESAAEEPIEQLLARRVYGRLGMRQTRYRPSLLLQERVVPTALRSERPYVLDAVVHDGNAFRLGGIAGHAGLFSTGMDVAVFAQTILNGGGYGNARVWSQATVQAFTTPQRLPGGRGLGWDVVADRSSAGDYFTARTVGHTGYTGTSLWIDLGREMFVVMLTNRTYDRGTAAQIFALRKRVHELAARSISDQRVLPRPGTAAARAAERSRRPAPRRTPRRPRRG